MKTLEINENAFEDGVEPGPNDDWREVLDVFADKPGAEMYAAEQRQRDEAEPISDEEPDFPHGIAQHDQAKKVEQASDAFRAPC